jgi:hypothetical protein
MTQSRRLSQDQVSLTGCLNRFGHPRAEVLERYAASRMKKWGKKWGQCHLEYLETPSKMPLPPLTSRAGIRIRTMEQFNNNMNNSLW